LCQRLAAAAQKCVSPFSSVRQCFLVCRQGSDFPCGDILNDGGNQTAGVISRSG
jgi:hypothetical protein